MNDNQVKLNFDTNFVGTLESIKGQIKIGQQTNGMSPYQLLFGALGSCFYATFLSVSNKMKLNFTDANIVVNGQKRTEVPHTLEYVTIDMVIYNGSNEEKLKKAALLGARYCSIHETISKVAVIDLVISFKEK